MTTRERGRCITCNARRALTAGLCDDCAAEAEYEDELMAEERRSPTTMRIHDSRPWLANRHDVGSGERGRWRGVTDARGRSVIALHNTVARRMGDEIAGDTVQLVAAAPDLWEALREIVSAHDAVMERGARPSLILDAIKDARGVLVGMERGDYIHPKSRAVEE